jgi:glycosyltransferase involved in cell wall biosynthesis
MTTVDLVVPCYNYARYLETCVASILPQRDVELRVLIIDDCSPDETPEVARRLAAADPRVGYVRNERNLGLIGTANRGVMEWARADYVVLISADDQLTPGSLARATRLMEAHPEVSMAYGMALMLNDGGPALTPPDPVQAPTRIVQGKAFLKHVCDVGNPVPTPCAVMRTRVQHKIGGYDARFPHTCDMDNWMRAALAGSIGVINAVHGLYRWHASNMSAAFQRQPIGDRLEVLATCRAFERRFGDKIPELGTWVQAMERGFGEAALGVANASFADPEDETWRDSLAFAREHWPGYRLSPAFWKLMLKGAVGRRRYIALRERLRPKARAAGGRAWHDHGAQIGWWPEAEACSG